MWLKFPLYDMVWINYCKLIFEERGYCIFSWETASVIYDPLQHCRCHMKASKGWREQQVTKYSSLWLRRLSERDLKVQWTAQNFGLRLIRICGECVIGRAKWCIFSFWAQEEFKYYSLKCRQGMRTTCSTKCQTSSYARNQPPQACEISSIW